MKHQDIVNSLSVIRPNAIYHLKNSELTWMDSEQSEPSQEEIEAGFIAYQEAEAQAKAEAEAKREAALSKLEALGLDEDDLKALGL